MLFKKMYSKSQLVPFFPLSPRLLKRKNFKRENKDEKQVQAKTHLPQGIRVPTFICPCLLNLPPDYLLQLFLDQNTILHVEFGLEFVIY